ncbi:MAG: carbon storage regulator [Planctomycetota bacterium]
MLVLSRKATERIHIGEDITIQVRRIAGNRVTLAIEAPRDVRILRGELEQAAKEFEDDQQPTEQILQIDAAAIQRAVNPTLPLPDTSDHGLPAYTV